MRKKSLKYKTALKCSLKNNSFFHYRLSSAHGVNRVQNVPADTERNQYGITVTGKLVDLQNLIQ